SVFCVSTTAAVKSRYRPPYVLGRPSNLVAGLRSFCGGRQSSLPASVCSAAAVKSHYQPPFVLRRPSKFVTGLRLFYDGRQSSLPASVCSTMAVKAHYQSGFRINFKTIVFFMEKCYENITKMLQ